MGKKINIAEIISARVRINNAEDADRIHAIEAIAELNGGAVQSIQEGRLSDLETGNLLASFSTWNLSQGNLSVGFESSENRGTTMTEIEAFISSAAELKSTDITI